MSLFTGTESQRSGLRIRNMRSSAYGPGHFSRVPKNKNEDLEDWAARHRIQITNARRNVRSMPRTSGGNGETKADLQDRIDELEAENEDLQSLLDSVYDLVSPGPDEDDEDVDDDDGR